MLLRFLYHSLLVDRGRTLLSVLAVAAVITLLIVLEGFKTGLWLQTRAYYEDLPVALVVTPGGSTGTLQARSGIDPTALDRIRALPGVSAVYPVMTIPTIFEKGGVKTPISVIGYDQVGGPWQLRAGRLLQAPGEAVMDYALAKKYGFALGDQAALLGREFRVVGLSSGTASMLGSYVFIGLDDAGAFLASASLTGTGAARPGPNLLLVEQQSGADASSVSRAITAAIPQVRVVTPTQLADEGEALMRGLLGSVFNLVVGSAYVAGVLVIGLTLYATVFERLREYGVMKAIGASAYHLYRYVLGQALVLALGGIVLGLLGGAGIAALLGWLLPQYPVALWNGEVLLRVSVAGLALAAVASLLPIRQVANVDPAMVFRQ